MQTVIQRIKGENCDGTDFKMGVAATLSEPSEWTLQNSCCISAFFRKLVTNKGGIVNLSSVILCNYGEYVLVPVASSHNVLPGLELYFEVVGPISQRDESINARYCCTPKSLNGISDDYSV